MLSFIMQFAKEVNSRKDDLYFNFFFLHHSRREADINSVVITLQHHHPSYFNQYLAWGLIHHHCFRHFNLKFRMNDRRRGINLKLLLISSLSCYLSNSNYLFPYSALILSRSLSYYKSWASNYSSYGY